ncbi:AAA family ATPase [Candidatus Methylospira mobilis]|uniref:AAA family ATPase n=1 Tax=Candidatus Methylospira mobilis TaxID=1808979 RepID=UPI0028EB3AA5|nr:AAA family ATPase [Candidatus Methylospira mobilis]WNV04851.1 AAA family ATPase [Candidatus Methylospira mobilis]
MNSYAQASPMDPGDWTRRLARPHRLYGREQAAASLMESFDRISVGQGEIVLVPGYSGVGKSALVQEIRRPVRNRNGFFLQGKFNQYQQNIPYFALRQALAGLARELQSEDEPLRQQWKSTLQQAVGFLGRLLVDLVPEFDSLLGPQPVVTEISPLEARHRFAGVLRNFFAAVCRPEHPVVLFIDDWQWADTASFELLKQLQIGTTLRYLLMIAPYRDNEVDRAHPLVVTVEELRRQNIPVSVIEIGNLRVKEVTAWVKDLLQPAVENPEALAKFIHSRTGGNPFFTQASLAFLHDFGLILFDQRSDCWRWTMETAGVAGLPEDVVELFRLRLLRLDQGSRDLLARAACLGSHFDLGSLAVISGRSPDECRSLLLATQEMVVPTAGDDAPPGFMFVHDRVQQAAYGLIPSEDLPSVRLEIGRLLLARLGPEQLAERLFEVAEHLNIGQLLIEDTAEQVQAVELNVAAACKARAATAYRAALQFHRAAGHFLAIPSFAEHLWSTRHELALSLLQEWAESEFLEGDRTAAEQCVEQAAAHARTPIEKAGVLNILIVQNTLLARYPEAIAAGQLALAALGIILPEKGYETACETEIDLVRRSLMGRSVASLADLPVMNHPEMRMAAKILITMGPPCYRSHQRLWGVIVPKVVNLTLRYGNIEQVGYSHPAFAGLLCWVANDLALAREFGELATRLMTHTFHSPSDRSVYALMFGSSVRHWFHPLKRGSEDYAEACEIGLQSGNLQYTAYAFGHNMYCRFYQGVALDDLIEESQRSLAFTRTRFNQWAIDLLEGGLRIFSSLSDAEENTSGCESLSEVDYLGAVEAHRNIQVTCIYKILKTFSLLLLGRYDAALEMSGQAEAILYTVGMQGLLPWPEHRFARLLILTALAPDADERRQAERRAELEWIIAQLRLWTDYCPENFEHQYQLAAAELARLDRRATEAMACYEQAIDRAGAGGFVQWEGIANERAARFWQECGSGRLAQIYWQQAYICFERWGSKAKLQAMENEYRRWLESELTHSPDIDDMPAEQTRNTLLEKQVQRLRRLALQSARAQMQIEVERQAGEQVRATEHLRAEVAERKRAEEALRLAKESAEEGLQKERTLMAAIVESSEDAIIGKTLDGIVTSWNRAAEKVFGYTAEDIIGQSALVLIPAERRDEEDILLAAIGSGKSVKPYETERVCKDGRRIDISVTVSPIRDKAGRVVGASKIARDITERKKMENALRESELYARSLIRELELSQTELQRFAEISAHHLQEPARRLVSYAQRLRIRLGDRLDDEEARQSLIYIEQSGVLMRDLVRGIEHYLSAGVPRGQVAMQDTASILAELSRRFAPRLAAADATLETGVLPLVLLDKPRFIDLLEVLLDNALTHRLPEAQTRIRVSGGQRETVTYLRVEDNGPGIPAEYRTRVFEVFERLATRPAGGIGIGLAIARRIVESMGGNIEIETSPLGGIAVVFELPVTQKAAFTNKLCSGQSLSKPVRPDNQGFQA